MPDPLPLGEQLDWTPAQAPARTPLQGAHVLLRPIAEDDAQSLFMVSHLPDGDPTVWTYLPDGPYNSVEHLRSMLAWAQTAPDSLYYAIVPQPGELALGISAYLRATPELGTIEIGHVMFGPPLQRTTAASEAIFLLLRHAFDELGYRRVEWKCNALNAASRRAAERFGFSFEGVFRKHMVVKGRNRDTAWFAIVDEDWPVIRGGHEAWLAEENFDSNGRQTLTLGEAIRGARR